MHPDARRRRSGPVLLSALAVALCACARPAPAPVPGDGDLAGLREFMAAYGRELAAGERAALGRRYDTAGAITLLDGRLFERSHAETAARYLGAWTPPLDFAWDTLAFHRLDPGTALVTGRFLWVRSGPDTAVYSYAGLLRSTPAGWRIRAEIETRLPRAP